MLIRKAKPEESQRIAQLILLAMEDIVYDFIGEESKEKALSFLDSLIKEKNNQYSYENCWLIESDKEILAASIVYEGARLYELRDAVAQRIKTLFNKNFQPEDETQAGEYYIDCLGVDPKQQGKGLGSKMFEFLIQEYVEKRKETLGLLVDYDNPHAKRLYLKLGFKKQGDKILAGKSLEHLQFTYNQL